jgi:hypothetical protein
MRTTPLPQALRASTPQSILPAERGRVVCEWGVDDSIALVEQSFGPGRVNLIGVVPVRVSVPSPHPRLLSRPNLTMPSQG